MSSSFSKRNLAGTWLEGESPSSAICCSAEMLWSSSDATILNPAPASDGMSATGTVLKAGTVTITVVADGVTEAVAITAGAGAVVSFELVVSVVPPAPAA